MCKFFAIATAALSGILLVANGASPASARQDRELQACFSKSNDDALLISECTKVLDRGGRVTADKRAHAYNERGVAYLRKGEFSLAIRDFDDAVQTHPYAIPFYNRGLTYGKKGDLDRSIQDYGEAIRLNPKYTFAYNNRGLAYQHKGDAEHAIRDFEELIRLDPKSASGYFARGSVYQNLKFDYDRAIRDYDEAIRLDPKMENAYGNRAKCHYQKDHYDRAVQDVSEVIRLNSGSAPDYNARGFVFAKMGNYDHAIRDLDTAIRLKPDYAEAYDSRGMAYTLKGEPDRAIRDLDEAIRLKPDHAVAYNNRATAYHNKGDDESAIRDLDKAIQLSPDNTQAFTDRGRLYERKGDLERAKADFNAALVRGPGKYSETKKAYQRARDRLAALGETASVGAPSVTRPALASDSNGSEAVRPGLRVALVIGNGAYANVPSLSNPQNDAREMAGALRDLGFKVIEGYNLDSTMMRGKITDFGAALPGASVSLFYYAGHGMQVAGKNYLVPVDARLERPSSLGVEAIEVGTVLADMEAEKRINLVFLDACRDNPLSRSLAKSFGASRSATVGQGLAQLNAGIGTLITFATSPDTVALDGSGRNSPFTLAMLKHIRTPGLEIRSMLTRVRADVIKATNEQQVPWDHSSLTGDFYFRPGS
jgi:tetratricopeptide (TPR) repeat protein